MKKFLSIMLTVCSFMSILCCANVGAETSWTDAFTITTSGGASTAGGDAQTATISKEDGKISISLPAKNTTNNRLYAFAKVKNPEAYHYDVEFALKVTEQSHLNSAVKLEINSNNAQQLLYIKLGGGASRLIFNDETVAEHTARLGTAHTYRIKGSGQGTASLYVDGVIVAQREPYRTLVANTDYNTTITVDNGGNSDPADVSLEILEFGTYNKSGSTSRELKDAEITDAFNGASDWTAFKTLVSTYKNELYLTDSEIAVADGLFSQEGIYQRLLRGTYTYPGEVAVAFRTAVAEQAKAEKWTEAFDITTLGGESTDGGEAQVAVTSKANSKISVSVPAKNASNNRLYVFAKAKNPEAYHYDVEFTLNVKEQGHRNSSVKIEVNSNNAQQQLLIMLGSNDYSLIFNNVRVAEHPVTLGTAHTYKIKGSGTGIASLYVDGVLVQEASPYQNLSGNVDYNTKLTVDNGGDNDPADVVVEMTNFGTYNKTQSQERDAADEAVVAAFKNVSDWETIKMLVTKVYKKELYVTDEEIAEAAMLTQDEIYKKLTSKTYGYVGEIASAFKTALAEQKTADAWLLTKTTKSGDYTKLDGGAIVLDVPENSEGASTGATVTYPMNNYYNFDISFKAQLDENLDYLGLIFAHGGKEWNLQIKQRKIVSTKEDFVYSELGGKAHVFRLVGSVASSSLNANKAFFYVDGKFVGALNNTGLGTTTSSAKFTVNANSADVEARIWDFYHENGRRQDTFDFGQDNDVTLVTYKAIPSDSKMIWASYDENGKMTSCTFSENSIVKETTALDVFNFVPPESFTPDYKVKAMLWGGVGTDCIPVVDSVERYTKPALQTPVNGFVFDTHTETQNEFLRRIDEDGSDSAIAWLQTIKRNIELSYPASLKFEWAENSSSEYIFELSKNEDFSDAYRLVCDENFCEIDNLEIGTKYYWRVNGGKPNYFLTEDNVFRFVKIDGALNVRDLGGNMIKQGLVYRGSDIDLNFPLTEKGIATFRDVLKIKTEIELRKEADGNRTSIAGEDILLKHLPYRPYIEVFEEEHRKGICDIMEFLSHEENYPVYIHCMGGADRTGMIAIYLRALAGENDDLIHTDYELTGLSTYAYGASEGASGTRSRNSSYYVEFLNELKKYAPTESLSGQVRAFLKDCGVTDECMDRILDIIKK